MKRNLILGTLLLATLGLVYWFEELGGQKQLALKTKAQEVVSVKLEDLESMHLPRAILVKEKGELLTSKDKIPASPKLIQEMMQILGGLSIVRTFTPEEIKNLREEDFFGANTIAFEFRFPGQTFSYRLGNVLQMGESFYVEMNHNGQKKWVLAKDTSPMEGMYQDKGQLLYQKYNRMRILLGLTEESFIDRRVFRPLLKKNLAQLEIQKIAVENFRNRPFTVLLQQKTTQPAPFSGISYSLEASDNYLQELLGLEALKLHLSKKKQKGELKESLSKIQVKLADRELVIETFRKWGKANGLFLVHNLDDTIYEVTSVNSRPLFANIQDFWDKKVHWPDELGKREEKFSLNFKGKDPAHFDLVIPPQESFEVKVLSTSSGRNLRPKADAFKGLFTMLLGMGPYAEAHRVSALTSTEEKQIAEAPAEENGFYLSSAQNQLLLTRKSDEIVLTDLKKKIHFHYLVGSDQTVGLKKEDYFESL